MSAARKFDVDKYNITYLLRLEGKDPSEISKEDLHALVFMSKHFLVMVDEHRYITENFKTVVSDNIILITTINSIGELGPLNTEQKSIIELCMHNIGYIQSHKLN